MKSPLTAATPVRLALLAALGVAATAANAQSMVTARVLGAQPVVEQVPVQECGPNRASGTGAAKTNPDRPVKTGSSNTLG